MEPKSVGLEDDSPFQFGGFWGSMLIFGVVYPMIIKERKSSCFSLFLQMFASLQLQKLRVSSFHLGFFSEVDGVHRSLPETKSQSLLENRPNAPKGKEKVFQPSIFTGAFAINFREGICGKIIKLIMDHTRHDMGSFILVSWSFKQFAFWCIPTRNSRERERCKGLLLWSTFSRHEFLSLLWFGGGCSSYTPYTIHNYT